MHQKTTPFGRIINEIEETLIAVILGLMTLITFTNVVMRYGFNTGLSWGLEVTAFLFAWLVLLGMSYAVKITAHLGVDAVLNLFGPKTRKILALIAVTTCIIYAFLLLKGAWDYWANFANLPQTTGRWFPTGFQDSFLGKAWYESEDTPMPGFLRFLEGWLNEGEAYEKLPRMIPYIMLPIGMGLLLFRFIQAGFRLFKGTQASLIVSHEAEDAVAEVAAARDAGV
ncbi:MAG: TRAP transporter small permease [Paracoccaceae bacterium]